MTNTMELKELFDEVYKKLAKFRAVRDDKVVVQTSQYKVVGMEEPFYFPYRD